MHTFIIKKYRVLFSIFLFFITGCAQFSLNFQDRIQVQEGETCPIRVIGSRSLKEVFIDALTIEPIPPLQEILYSKLCQRDTVQKFIQDGTELTVYVSNLRLNKVNHLIFAELIGYTVGQVQVRRPGEEVFHKYLIMPTPTQLRKFFYLGKTAYKDFIEYVLEDFITEIENTIYLIRENDVKQNTISY
ncbi:MAG: hypothetical protein E3K32_13840 [wastewater metagenome]|nr:hypothetical protein [Candidatus Loosdrechtia aerotolerans]